MLTEEEVVRKFSDMVYRLAVIRMNQPEDADDIYQEVFLKYMQSGLHIQEEEHLKAWLIRVTVNCCNSAHTSWWRKKTLPLEEYENAGAEENSSVSDKVLDAVRKLSEKDRVIVHLFYYEEYSIKEISRILHKTEGAVKTRLSRARNRLQEILTERSSGK